MSLQKLAKACALALAVVFSASAAHADQKVYTLKLSHFVPPQHAFHKWVVKWTEMITKESHGRLKFQIYPNGQLVGPPNRQFDAARNGIVDIAWCLNGVTPGRYPMTELANLPFSWPSAGVDLPLMAKRLTELAPKYLASEYPGLHILFMNMANPVVVYSKEPIHSVAGFKGKKIRYASTANREMLDAMGAVPSLVPPPATQDALAKGIVEGATFPHEAGLAYHLASVVHYTIEPPTASATFALVMNKAKYESLPKDLRAILDKESGVKGAMSFGRAWAKQEVFARHLETTKMGLHIIELPPAEVAKEHEIAKPIIKRTI
ncbi:MAG TPA: TRAP transporter substrate-binding protein, partial [Pseudolabrys sp.]|nr:TRAP transporter substrate-binding protein [Pseudolabrys sp.]